MKYTDERVLNNGKIMYGMGSEELEPLLRVPEPFRELTDHNEKHDMVYGLAYVVATVVAIILLNLVVYHTIKAFI